MTRGTKSLLRASSFSFMKGVEYITKVGRKLEVYDVTVQGDDLMVKCGVFDSGGRRFTVTTMLMGSFINQVVSSDG